MRFLLPRLAVMFFDGAREEPNSSAEARNVGLKKPWGGAVDPQLQHLIGAVPDTKVLEALIHLWRRYTFCLLGVARVLRGSDDCQGGRRWRQEALRGRVCALGAMRGGDRGSGFLHPGLGGVGIFLGGGLRARQGVGLRHVHQGDTG